LITFCAPQHPFFCKTAYPFNTHYVLALIEVTRETEIAEVFNV